MLNWTLRYLPVVTLLDHCDAQRVLDVGSGWHGLSRYRAGTVVQTDLQFGGHRPTTRTTGQAVYVCASADSLPFGDSAFDYVVSLDLFEHLPPELRVAAMMELTRVALRGVIVGFPFGTEAARVDQRLARRLQRLGRDIPDWLDEHLAQSAYPDERTVLDALPPGWGVTKDMSLGNVHLLGAVVLAEQLPVLQRVVRSVDAWYSRFGPLSIVNRGRSYRRLWLLTPN
jgi:SAM-dependent methyltransferase